MPSHDCHRMDAAMAGSSDCLIGQSEQRPVLEYARVSEFIDALKAHGAQIASAVSVNLRMCHAKEAPPTGLLCWSYLCASATLHGGRMLELRHFLGGVQCLVGEEPPEPIVLYGLLTEIRDVCRQLGLVLRYAVEH